MSLDTKYVRDMTNFVWDLCRRPRVDGRIDLAVAYCLLIPLAFVPARQGSDPLSDKRFFEAIIASIWLAFGFGFALGAIRCPNRIFLLLSIPIALCWAGLIGLAALKAWQTLQYFHWLSLQH